MAERDSEQNCEVSGRSRLEIEELEEQVVSLATRVNAAEYEFLMGVREFDLRQGWKRYHFNNCAEWLNMRCGIVLGTAREKVRTAHALAKLPAMSEAFQKGELSYSNVRALTRVATAENEGKLIAYAKDRRATTVEKYCRHLRNVQRAESARDANQIFKERFLSYTVMGDGTVSLTVELPPEEGELVMRAIEHAAKQLADEGVSDENDSLQQRQADGLVRIAREYLTEGASDGKKSSAADHYQVVVHVDESALTQGEGKSDLPIETVRRMLCDSSMTAVIEDMDGNPLNVGRKKRVVPPQLRRALVSRDDQCRYPGCGHKLWLEAHHVMHWIDGGETRIDNLMLLCARHHRLLHEGAFDIERTGEGDLYIRTNKGQVLNFIREPCPETYARRAVIG